MQISREIRGEWLPNLHHLATYQSVHCRRPSDRTFPPPHSGTCTCSRSPTEPPPTHHLVLPPPPSQRDPPLHPDLPTTSSGHEQYVNFQRIPYLLSMHSQHGPRGTPITAPPPTPERMICSAQSALHCLWLKPHDLSINGNVSVTL